MSELRVIPVTFGGEHTTVTECRIRHDWGQVYKFLDIDLPDVFEARFSNAPTGASVPQIGKDNMVEIPAQFFESGAPIYCYITLHDEETDGRTVYTVKTPISPSSDRTDAEPEPEEESIITQAITALNTAVDKTAQDVIDADEAAQSAKEDADRAEHAADGIEAYVERAEAAQQASESARDKAEEAKASAQESAAATTEGLNEVRYYVDIINKAYVKIDDWTQIAYGASQQAIASEQASTESARQASQSAETASTKAQEASGFASEASQKASEASQSASSASQAKTDAETAKTAAETAQGKAEDAQAAAESVAESIPSDYSQLSEDVTELNSGLNELKENLSKLGLSVVDGKLCITYEEVSA